jgi:thiamine biosynthesis lipoprotein
VLNVSDHESFAQPSEDADPTPGAPPRSELELDPSLLTHVSRRAMATDFVAILPAHRAEAVEVVVEAMETLDRIEADLTIYRGESEISQINRQAFDRPVSVSATTFRLIEKAIEWSGRTGGAFDITAGPLIDAWGFTRRSGRKPTQQEVDQALEKVGYGKVILSPSQRSIRFQHPGMSINLGAIGKGDALDRIAASLRQQGVDDFLLHGGNSSVIAGGDQSPGSGRGWAVGLSHPTKPKRRLAGLWLRNMALATSGSGKQFFHHRGRRYGHVIDPRTGYPAGDLLSLTVLMPSAADADACATGLFVAGSATIGQLQDQSWLPPLIMMKSGPRQDAVEIESSGKIPWCDPERPPSSESNQ